MLVNAGADSEPRLYWRREVRNMKRTSSALLFFLAAFLAKAFSSPVAVLHNWEDRLALDNREAVRFSSGDSSEYAAPGFDDSLWPLLSLPLSPGDLKRLERSEGAVYWYRVRIRLPEGYPQKALGIQLGKIADVDETRWNGTLIGTSGSIDDPSSHASNRLRQYEIPAHALRPGEENVLAVRVRNTWRADELPGRGNYFIGDYDAMRSAFFRRGMRELAFPVVYFVFFAYFLLLYSKRTRQKENLLYSLFSIAFALYSACRTDIKYEFISNFRLLQKLEFGSMYAAIPLLMAFVLSFFREKQTRFHYGYYVFSAVCLAALAAMRNHLHWYNLNVYFIQYTWIFPFFELFRTLVKNYRKSADARIMFSTFAFVCAAIAHDILLSRGIRMVPFIGFWLTPFAMFAYVSGIATILSVRFAKSMNQIEELNATLERKVEERTAALDKSLQEISLRDEKIQRELVMAGSVQQALLPERIPDWPVRIAVRYKPLREVSGDFYHFAKTLDGGYLMYIGDVSGHGMPAALYAILAVKAYSEAARSETSPAAILSRVNDDLCRLDTTHYLTSFMVKYDGEGRLHFSNAGHPRAILLSRRKKKITMLDTAGTVIGIRDDARDMLQDAEIPFEQGDRILLYTDCLVERANAEGEQFGETRLVDTLKKFFFEDLDALIDKTLETFFAFAGGAENKDDLTIAAMEIE